MIQTLDKSFEEVRTVLRNDINEVSVCRSLSANDSGYYTVIRLKDRTAQARLLKIFSSNSGYSSAYGFVEASAIESGIAIVFRYNKESSLFYYRKLYCRDFSARLNAAKNLLAELMCSPLPVEMLYLLLEKRNLNLCPDGRVYFNYFMDFGLLPAKIGMQDIVNKAAETIFEFLAHGLKLASGEAELFKVKVLRKSFGSFGEIYSDLKRISPDAETGPLVSGRIKSLYDNQRPRILSAAKTAVVILVIAASILYSITEWRNRSIAAAQDMSGARPAYRGLEKIGTVMLAEGTGSDTDNTSLR